MPPDSRYRKTLEEYSIWLCRKHPEHCTPPDSSSELQPN
jgi:hypothetical protein